MVGKEEGEVLASFHTRICNQLTWLYTNQTEGDTTLYINFLHTLILVLLQMKNPNNKKWVSD